MPTRLERQEQLIKTTRTWARQTRKELLFELASQGLAESHREIGEDSTPPLSKSIRYGIKRSYGELDSVSFRFVRHGIFVEHGVGKGRPKGSSKALASAQPWLQPVLEPEVSNLADILSEEYADLVVDEIRFLIPGVLDVRAKGGRDRFISGVKDDGSPIYTIIDRSFF